ncbi:AraC family transcriptional regulator [Tateyamaria sp. SN3-11]|uniref:AraC family transcriptional regulator n=1 Tax=Tateyamaria sp. SN3-11 TaxID=3092147 RepID=UPI0039ED97B3
MTDPLSEVISLLCPQAPSTKLVHASAPFRVSRDDVEAAFYCMLLEGQVRLEVDSHAPVNLSAGSFVLIPDIAPFEVSSLDPPPPAGLVSNPIAGTDGITRLGTSDAPATVKMLVGHCSFGSSDAELLVSLLPDMILMQGEDRLATLAAMIQDEMHKGRPARDAIVEHLLQILLIEAFRSTAQSATTSALTSGLTDPRIGPALRAIHAAPDHAWTVPELAREAGLSRSAFFTRFSRIIGVTPMGYLLNWRMTLAKHMLRSGSHGIAEVTDKIGYGSASAFSTAFARHVGAAPGKYARVASAD